MKATFITKLEEEIPEDSSNYDHFSVKTLVLAFKESEEHWMTKVRNNFDYSSLIL